MYGTVSEKIAILGWSFKKDTNDSRESSSIYISDNLINEMAQINVFDPQVKESKIYDDLIL